LYFFWFTLDFAVKKNLQVNLLINSSVHLSFDAYTLPTHKQVLIIPLFLFGFDSTPFSPPHSPYFILFCSPFLSFVLSLKFSCAPALALILLFSRHSMVGRELQYTARWKVKEKQNNKRSLVSKWGYNKI